MFSLTQQYFVHLAVKVFYAFFYASMFHVPKVSFVSDILLK